MYITDIAIGAPYESERGAIYIYHGSLHGIKSQYVQRIFAAEIDESLTGFGISISRPVDVDANNYSDILVGSFLSDNAILLRSRPIVRVFHNITFQPHQINPKKSSCNFTTGHCFKTIYCFGYEGIYVPLKLDFVVELRSFRRRNFLQPRDYFTDHRNKQTSFIRQEIIMKKGITDCISYDTHVRGDSDDQVNPIQINSILFLKHNISEEVSFCKDCPVLDPTFPNFTVGVISFRTGCAQSDKCSSDLKLNANISGLSNGELILGKDKEISIVAEIRRSGDPAFKTEMIIYIEENLDLIKGKYCRQSRDISKGLRLICLIGNPFDRTLIKQEIKLDSSKISSNQEHISILMDLTTLSEEINPVDNFVNITIPIKLSADIGITGRAERELILLKKGEPSNELYEFVHIYNVMKYLYSPISLVNVVFSIPTSLIDTNTKFVKLESVKILNPDHSNSVSGICNFKNTENDHMKYDEDLNITIRSKRSINNIVMSVDVDKNLKINCETSKCQEVVCSVGPFDEKRKSSTFYIKGYINVKVLKSASKEWDNLTFTSEGRVSIIDKRRNIQPINHKPDKSKVITYIVSSITLKRGKIAKWILPVSIASGIVLITIILVVLLKLGFFRRKKREDVQMLKANLLMEKSPINEEIPDGK
ncbi:integrin alpha-9-like isoform X1 [Centruroides sculpturatus]|uniref:integrin alpha-9-like isoform X1 n=1 Tax=Centruroides sculpturatus TaxID=218467 RepID=UPI000C6DEF4A|nr:integrin alpha-9-like isoform X1 [Centruroides sculpturatus]